MATYHQTVLEINLDALVQNFQYLKSRLQSKTRFLAVVKANAYGSDAIKIAKKLEKLGADYLAVAYTNEGIILRKNGIKAPILVLHPQINNLDKCIDYSLEPNLYSFATLRYFLKLASKKNTVNYPVHIKFNTGLNRLGFVEDDVFEVSEILNKTFNVQPITVFSHLAASEDLDEKKFTLQQIKRFNSIIEKVKKTFHTKPLFHLCNTSGILNYPEAHYDMVRSGIGLYGFSNILSFQKNFCPIASLKSVVSQIHTISKGESVGYNRAYICKSESEKIAVIPVGHADGISRSYGGGKGWVTINGKKAPIVGNVCMDVIMVKTTHLPCKEGDEVIFFGKNPTAETLTREVQSISYELITAISPRIKRVFIEKP